MESEGQSLLCLIAWEDPFLEATYVTGFEPGCQPNSGSIKASNADCLRTNYNQFATRCSRNLISPVLFFPCKSNRTTNTVYLFPVCSHHKFVLTVGGIPHLPSIPSGADIGGSEGHTSLTAIYKMLLSVTRDISWVSRERERVSVY